MIYQPPRDDDAFERIEVEEMKESILGTELTRHIVSEITSVVKTEVTDPQSIWEPEDQDEEDCRPTATLASNMAVTVASGTNPRRPSRRLSQIA